MMPSDGRGVMKLYVLLLLAGLLNSGFALEIGV